MDTSLALVCTVCIGGSLTFAPLKEYITETWVPFTAVIFPYSESLKTNKTMSSRMGNLLLIPANNYRALEGSVIKLDMASNLITLLERKRELYCEWYWIF